jgi:integrase
MKGRVCAAPRSAKNLENQTRIERPCVGGTNETNADIKGRIVQYAFWMEKQGYAKETIRGNIGALRALQSRATNLLDPESVKEALSKEQKWSPNRRRNVINSYTLFLKVIGQTWEKPKCQVTRKFPWIPTEAELNSLISGCGAKTSTFLLLLKETAMRSGEAKRLEWVNVDAEKNIIILNDPEKGSKPRMWKVSAELIGMLKMMQKTSTKVFGDGPINSLKTTYIKTRKRLAAKLQNPRLLNISFHTFRHWKATMLYHKTKDPYYVKDFLGHKCLSNTEIYINIERTLFEDQSDEFTVKVAEKPEDIKSLLETGFEYVCQKDDLVYMRKRK